MARLLNSRKERRGSRIIQRLAGDSPHTDTAQLPRADLGTLGGVTATALVRLLVLGVLYALYFARTLLVPSLSPSSLRQSIVCANIEPLRPIAQLLRA